jgi:hypothetical protein
MQNVDRLLLALCFGSPVLIELREEPIDIFLLQVVGSRQTQLMGIAATNADFMRLPQPILQLHPRNRRHIDAHDCATEICIGRCP